MPFVMNVVIMCHVHYQSKQMWKRIYKLCLKSPHADVNHDYPIITEFQQLMKDFFKCFSAIAKMLQT